MIYGLNDDVEVYEPEEEISRLDELKQHLKLLEKEIQEEEAAKQLRESVSEEKKKNEVKSITNQLNSLTKALEQETMKVQQVSNEISLRMGKVVAEPPKESEADICKQLEVQNVQTKADLDALMAQLTDEVGPELDVDTIIKNGPFTKTREDQLNRLKSEYSKISSAPIGKTGIDEALEKHNKEVDTLLMKQASLEDEISELKTKISQFSKQLSEAEERNRALRTMYNLLEEKKAHDEKLIDYLDSTEEIKSDMPPEEIPPLTPVIVRQLRVQQMIIHGLLYKLDQKQSELSELTVPKSMEFMVPDLNTLNDKCVMLEKMLLEREAKETDEIELNI